MTLPTILTIAERNDQGRWSLTIPQFKCSAHEHSTIRDAVAAITGLKDFNGEYVVPAGNLRFAYPVATWDGPAFDALMDFNIVRFPDPPPPAPKKTKTVQLPSICRDVLIYEREPGGDYHDKAQPIAAKIIAVYGSKDPNAAVDAVLFDKGIRVEEKIPHRSSGDYMVWDWPPFVAPIEVEIEEDEEDD